MNIMSNASDTAAGMLWSTLGGFVEECYQKNNVTGQLLSTAFVARDMMQIVDALGEDGMLRYWGMFFGATAAEHI